jgi:hypothetical protein
VEHLPHSTVRAYQADPLYCSKKGDYSWTHKLPSNRVKVGRENILVESSGTNFVPTNPVDAFQHFFPDSLLDYIISISMEDSNQQFDITLAEFKSFLGALIFIGVNKGSKRNSRDLWNSTIGFPILICSMPHARFIEILRYIRFESKHIVNEYRHEDKLIGIRYVVDHLADLFRSSYRLSGCCAVDEMLSPFYGRCPFRQYIKEKLSKFGIKLWILSDCETYYCGNFEVYLGAKTVLGKKKREKGLGERVVKDLCNYIFDTGRNVTTDNYFTSISLAEDLLKHKLTLLGTMRINRVGIPRVMLPDQRRGVHSSIFAFKDKLTMVSYATKGKSSSRCKQVTILSSMHHDDRLAEDGKPVIIHDYNETKGAVDTLTELVKEYTCKRGVRKWYKSLFFTLIDIAMHNSFVLLKSASSMNEDIPIRSRKEFFVDVSVGLMMPWIIERAGNPKISSQPTVNQSLKLIGVIPIASMQSSSSELSEGSEEERPKKKSRPRCAYCPRDLDRKSCKCCRECGKFLCLDHSEIIAVCKEGCK